MKTILIAGSMGCYLKPPGHPSNKYGFKSGKSYMSVEYAAEQNYDKELKKRAQQMLDNSEMVMTEEWVKEVYTHFQFCYSKNGKDCKIEDIFIDKENKSPKENHCAYLFIKKYFPNAEFRADLI